MARADSVIRVSIIGDASKLGASVKQADSQLGKMGASVKGIGTALVGLAAANEVVSFLRDASQEADRLGDSATRLRLQLGTDLAGQVEKVAGGFTKLGLSQQDVQELAANFADLATTVGIADPIIANLAPTVVATAQALQLLGKGDTAGNVDLIGKAASGSEKAAKALGVTLIAGADATTQLNNILTQLAPTLATATSGTGDLEQKQAELQARVETLSAQVGGPLNDALSATVGFILDEIDAIPGAIEGFQKLGRQFEDLGRTLLTPLARLNDLNNALAEAAGTRFVVSPGRDPRSPTSDSGTTRAVDRDRARNGLGSLLGGP